MDRSLMRLDRLTRDLGGSGTGIDETVTRLKENGATLIECLKIVREVEGVTLGAVEGDS